MRPIGGLQPNFSLLAAVEIKPLPMYHPTLPAPGHILQIDGVIYVRDDEYGKVLAQVGRVSANDSK